MGMYDDIIDLPPHVSKTRPRMPMYKRAAQFKPFAPLKGYDFMISEATRVTEERITLTEDEQCCIDLQLQVLSQKRLDIPKAAFTYFVPDVYKDGGAYETVYGYIQKIDPYKGIVILREGTRFKVEDLVRIETVSNDMEEYC